MDTSAVVIRRAPTASRGSLGLSLYTVVLLVYSPIGEHRDDAGPPRQTTRLRRQCVAHVLHGVKEINTL